MCVCESVSLGTVSSFIGFVHPCRLLINDTSVEQTGDGWRRDVKDRRVAATLDRKVLRRKSGGVGLYQRSRKSALKDD